MRRARVCGWRSSGGCAFPCLPSEFFVVSGRLGLAGGKIWSAHAPSVARHRVFCGVLARSNGAPRYLSYRLLKYAFRWQRSIKSWDKLPFCASAGLPHAFAVAATFVVAPAARLGLGLVVKNPAAIGIATDFDARRMALAENVRERPRRFGQDSVPAGNFRNKFQLQPILALQQLHLAG